jgi:hypothetical protein
MYISMFLHYLLDIIHQEGLPEESVGTDPYKAPEYLYNEETKRNDLLSVSENHVHTITN